MINHVYATDNNTKFLMVDPAAVFSHGFAFILNRVINIINEYHNTGKVDGQEVNTTSEEIEIYRSNVDICVLNFKTSTIRTVSLQDNIEINTYNFDITNINIIVDIILSFLIITDSQNNQLLPVSFIFISIGGVELALTLYDPNTVNIEDAYKIYNIIVYTVRDVLNRKITVNVYDIVAKAFILSLYESFVSMVNYINSVLQDMEDTKPILFIAIINEKLSKTKYVNKLCKVSVIAEKINNILETHLTVNDKKVAKFDKKIDIKYLFLSIFKNIFTDKFKGAQNFNMVLKGLRFVIGQALPTRSTDSILTVWFNIEKCCNNDLDDKVATEMHIANYISYMIILYIKNIKAEDTNE